jgi:hypothetical protein
MGIFSYLYSEGDRFESRRNTGYSEGLWLTSDPPRKRPSLIRPYVITIRDCVINLFPCVFAQWTERRALGALGPVLARSHRVGYVVDRVVSVSPSTCHSANSSLRLTYLSSGASTVGLRLDSSLINPHYLNNLNETALSA